MNSRLYEKKSILTLRIRFVFLLCTDLHLTDNPDDEYRWDVFDHIRSTVSRYAVSHVFCLGDIVDRKDRFPGVFVNRLLGELKSVAPITVMRGNHDTTLHPPYYFSFLSEEFMNSEIAYISEPTEFNDKLLLLPFSPRPREEWKAFKLSNYKCVFMHATVNGARAENGQIMENPGFPMLPGFVKFFSGDIHTAQQVRNVTYVGCPHPIKFGDDYPCRMLLIDENTFDIVHEIKLTPPRKLMVDISSIDDLRKIKAREGDQVKLRFSSDPSKIDGFGEAELEIARWAKQSGITIAGTEVIIHSEFNKDVDVNQTPEAILKQFAEHEQITDDLLGVGLSLLRETLP